MDSRQNRSDRSGRQRDEPEEPPEVAMLAAFADSGNPIAFNAHGDGAYLRIQVPRSDDENVLLLKKHYMERTFLLIFKPVPDR